MSTGSKTEIKAEVKNLEKIFVGEGFFYQIPNFQRPYRWKQEHVEKLIEDLADAFQKDKAKKYFCGSSVLIKNNDRYDVIDGQQRLTTFTILFCVLRDFYENDLTSEKVKDFIKVSIQDRYEKTKKKLKLLTHEANQNDFLQKILKGIHPDDIKEKPSDKNRYLQNAYFLKKLIDEDIKGKGIGLKEFTAWLFETVVMTMVICPDEEIAIKIFNVLNDRGMPLSSVDILKARLMEKLSPKERNTFSFDWEIVREKIEDSNIDFELLFRFYSHYKIAGKSDENLHDGLFNKFKQESPEKKIDSLKILDDIKRFAESYIHMIRLKNKYFYCLNYLKHQMHWKSMLISAIHVGYEDFDKLIELLFAYYYQNWIVGTTLRSYQKFSYQALKLIKEKKSIDDIKNTLKNGLASYKNHTGMTHIYKEEIAQDYIYHQSWLKPTLLFLEYFSKDDSNQNFIPLSDAETEHILPQNRDDNNGWNEIFTKEERDKYTDCLGNLTLLSMKKNRGAYDKNFEEKKKVYTNKDNVATSFELTRQIFENEKWTKKEIEERKSKLIDFLNSKIDIFK